jgi:uncharacterized OB-fold protein
MDDINITGYKCKACGRIHYPKHEQCLDCRGREFDKVSPQGNAKLLAYTQIFNLPWGFDDRFLIIGIAEFENGLRAMGQIEAASLDELKTGMTLQARWEPVRIQHGEPVLGIRYHPVS